MDEEGGRERREGELGYFFSGDINRISEKKYG